MVEQRSMSEVNLPEVLQRLHTYGVVIPYGSDYGKNGPKLTPFSMASLTSTLTLYKNGSIKYIILCGEEEFRGEQNTTDLMEKYLLEKGLPKEHIISLRKPEYNGDNTAWQIESLVKFQQKHNVEQQGLLLVNFAYHSQRIHNHMKGFSLQADTISVEDVLATYYKEFNHKRFDKKIGKHLEASDQFPRMLSSIDKKGRIPRLLSTIVGARTVVLRKDETGKRKPFVLTGKTVYQQAKKKAA